MKFHTCLKTVIAASWACLIPSALYAAPVIKIDSLNNDLGTLSDKGQPFVNFEFKVKNIGDAPLIIKEVRPGCGCTAVAFDTTIAAGKAGKITGKIDLKNIQGSFRKSISLTSNSSPDPSLSLSVSGKIEPVLGFSPGNITFVYNASKKEVAAELTLSTKKSDLKISGVKFKIESGASAIAWQADLPTSVESALSKPTTDKTTGISCYVLRLSIASAEDLKGYGAVTIKTNHPDRPELSINGVIQGH